MAYMKAAMHKAHLLDSDSEEDDDLVEQEHASKIEVHEEDDEVLPTFRTEQTRSGESIYESLDYDVCENELWQKEQLPKNSRFSIRKDVSRWFICLLIGMLTAAVACIINIVIEVLSLAKFKLLRDVVNENIINGDLSIPFLLWMALNVIPVVIGSLLVTYVEPVAAGSGIPQVKCYLNGVKVPRIVRVKTLLVKTVGVITSVVGGLAGGKEGPMIHSGAVIAAGISQGKSTTFKKDMKIFRQFRDDHEKRDFVVTGAAAGVAAAFGAPIGGVLFSLEEAASFWNQSLIWRTFFTSVISSFTLNVILSAYHGMKTFDYPGLFNLGKFEELPFEFYELPIFMLMGLFGGLNGAIWNSLNTKINIFRRKFVKARPMKVVEAALVACISCMLACVMIYLSNDCRPQGTDPNETPIQLFCKDNEYNAAAALWFQTPEATVKSLFHDPPGSHTIITLVVFVLIYFFLACISFGLNVSLGIFIPTLLCGAAWGRLTASFLAALPFKPLTFIHPGKYALIGAAAQLGGVLRMTLSLSVILIETTGNISFGFPIILTITVAKLFGDYFNRGIYDTQIEISNVPMLSWSLPVGMNSRRIEEVMSRPVICVKMKEEFKYLYEILTKSSYNGFPVVDEVEENDRTKGRLRGIILRSQLIVILKNSLYMETQRIWKDDVSINLFRREYPRYPSIKDIKIHEDKTLHNYHVDMTMFMNPTPYSALKQTLVPRVFSKFRALGLRHIVVTDANNRVQGIVTRKDFLRD